MKAFCCFLVLFVFWRELALAQKTEMPRELALRIGGFFGPTYRVDLREGKVYYGVQTSGENKERLTTYEPSQQQWSAFKKSLDEIGVWNWKKDYERPVMDGTQWSFTIKYRSERLESTGSNDYPKGYEKFLEAVKRLIDGQSFQ